MVDTPDASGPPYPYPNPLPAEAKQAHMRAIAGLKRRLNRWVLLAFIPGFTVALYPVLWWFQSAAPLQPSAAAPMLIGGSALGLVGAVPTVRISRHMRRHIRLLRSYGVPLNSAGIEFGSAKPPSSPGAPLDGVDLDDNAATRARMDE